MTSLALVKSLESSLLSAAYACCSFPVNCGLSNTGHFPRSISWASIDLSNVVMNTSMSSDKVSLVNFSESTPNSCLGLRGSLSARDAAIVLYALTFELFLLPSVAIPPPFVSIPARFFVSPRPGKFLPLVGLVRVNETLPATALLNSDVIAVSPLTFPECRNQVK